MSLNNKKKKYIRKHVNYKSLDEISSNINISREEILKYLNKIWKKEKYQKYIISVEDNIEHNNSCSIKSILKKNIKVVMFLIFLVLVAYFNSFDNGFVSDDIYAILKNPQIGDFDHIFINPLFFLSPLAHYLIYLVSGLSPTAFRLWNVFLHIGSVLGTFIIIHKLINKRVAVLTSIIFAVHPIIVESVTWISGYVSTQSGFFFILSFLFFIYSKKFDRFYYISLFILFLSISSSQRAVSFPLIFIVYHFLFEKVTIKRIIPYILLMLFFGSSTLFSVETRISDLETNYYQQSDLMNPFIQIPVAISTYFEILMFPKNLTLYQTELAMNKFEYLIRLIFTLGFFISFIYFFFKNKKVLFWLLLFFIALAPTLTPFGISWIVAERYAYLSSIGIFVVFSMFINWLMTRFPNYEKLLLTFFGIIILVLSIRTIVRNNDWQNEDTLWVATVKTSPSSHNAHNNMGDVYARHGEYEKAIEEFKLAVKIKPNYADAYHNIGVTYSQINDLENAEKYYLKAIEINPNLWQSYQNLGVIYFNIQDMEKAEQMLLKAYEINPNLNLLMTLAKFYTQTNNIDKAIIYYQKVLQIDPVNITASQELSKLQVQQ